MRDLRLAAHRRATRPDAASIAHLIPRCALAPAARGSSLRLLGDSSRRDRGSVSAVGEGLAPSRPCPIRLGGETETASVTTYCQRRSPSCRRGGPCALPPLPDTPRRRDRNDRAVGEGLAPSRPCPIRLAGETETASFTTYCQRRSPSCRRGGPCALPPLPDTPHRRDRNDLVLRRDAYDRVLRARGVGGTVAESGASRGHRDLARIANRREAGGGEPRPYGAGARRDLAPPQYATSARPKRPPSRPTANDGAPRAIGEGLAPSRPCPIRLGGEIETTSCSDAMLTTVFSAPVVLGARSRKAERAGGIARGPAEA